MSDVSGGQNTGDLNERVRNWWNRTPYTYGLSKEGNYQDVGDVDDARVDGRFFDNYMRKVHKHFEDAQRPGERVASRFIDYAALKGKRVLDIACGVGWATVEMASAGARITGIDVTPRAVQLARKHVAHRGLDAEICVMDAQRMEFPDHTFDFVHAWGCLMHMPDTQKAIAEIFRVLKPNGTTSGYMYNKRSVSYWWNFWLLRGVLMGKLITYKGDTTRLVSRYTDGDTIGGNALTKVYTPEEARAMFEKAGFVDVVFRPWGPPGMLKYFPVRSLPLGSVLPYRVRRAIAGKYGWGMVYQARKPG